MVPGSTMLWGRSPRRAAAIAVLLLALVAPPVFPHGSLHEQIRAVSAQIALHPHDARIYFKRAELHRLHGELAAALSDYDRAAGLDPSLEEVDLGRGKALFEGGRPRDARPALERFLRRRPDHADGRLALARTFSRLGLSADADAQYARVVALVPLAKPDVYFERASALADDGRLDEAVRALDEGIARLGPLVALEDLAIELERRRKNYDGALVRIDRMNRGSARREAWLVRRGEILEEAGRPSEAEETLREAKRAIESLPSRVRSTRAVEKLESRVRASLERFEKDRMQRGSADAKS